MRHFRGRRARSRIPRRALRHLPIAPTLILKVRITNDLLLRRNERINRAHPVLLRRASLDPGHGGDAVVDDDADLLPWDGRTLENCIFNVLGARKVAGEEMNLRWNWTLVANGASSDTLKDRLWGIRS